MNEQLENLITEFSLGIISNNDQKKLNTLLRSATHIEKMESTKLYIRINSLALSADEINLPSLLKKKIFSELPNTELKKTRNTIKLNLIQFVSTIAATILISVSIALTLSATFNSRSEVFSQKKLTQFAHMKQVEKIALCSQVTEKLMKQANSNTFTAAKIYLNMSKKSLVLHICKLPKLESKQCFTLWAVDSHGTSFQIVHNISLSDEIIEKNFILTKIPQLNNKMNFIISIESKTDITSKKPSDKILLKS